MRKGGRKLSCEIINQNKKLRSYRFFTLNHSKRYNIYIMIRRNSGTDFPIIEKIPRIFVNRFTGIKCQRKLLYTIINGINSFYFPILEPHHSKKKVIRISFLSIITFALLDYNQHLPLQCVRPQNNRTFKY